MPLPRTLLPALAALAAALAAPTLCLAQDVVPPDNAGGGAYVPGVSQASGKTPESDLRDRAGGGLATAAIRRRFEAAGADGAAAAALAEATAPTAGEVREPEPFSLAPLALAGATLAAAVTEGAAPAPARQPNRGLEVGFVGDQFGGDLLTNADPEIRSVWWRRLAATNSSLVRINLYWNQIAGQEEPEEPADPADPSYDWTIPDVAAREAEARGLEAVFTVVGAPRWAEGPNPPPEDSYRVGSWKPNPGKLGSFAEAAARRYSGEGELPGVRYWEAWNEPNIPQYLAPQWQGGEPRSPALYREMLNSFYEAVKAVDPENVVIAAGTSPFGDEVGGTRMRPYLFWRELLCLEDRELLAAQPDCTGESGYARMDVYAHHPINAVPGEGPTSPPPHPDDGVPANFGELTEIVRAAEGAGTILPEGLEREGWASELWYESNPPERKAVGLDRQARFMEQALQVLWDQGAAAAIFLQLRDDPYDPTTPALVGFQTGVYLPGDEPKPSLEAVQFPFVAERLSSAQVRIWGRAPRSGRLSVRELGGERRLERFRVDRGRVFDTVLELPEEGSAKRLEAEVGGFSSLPWPLD